MNDFFKWERYDKDQRKLMLELHAIIENELFNLKSPKEEPFLNIVEYMSELIDVLWRIENDRIETVEDTTV